MPYESVDRLQKVLAEDVFHYAKDAKKAAGRALGTLVEIVTFYLLKSWGFERSVAVEQALGEYGNPGITHNVEYSLHPVMRSCQLTVCSSRLPVTASRILRQVDQSLFPTSCYRQSGLSLMATDRTLRNACIVARGERSRIVATLVSADQDCYHIVLVEQHMKPYAMVECKRVGVEEGVRKGPQTIEKAKQGAYVARAVSSLQKLRTGDGELRGLIYGSGDAIYTKPYLDLVAEVIASESPELLRDFVLTVGVASNHGNWFTSENHNKELKVLAQSYDYLLFLTDEGLSEFITTLLLEPAVDLMPAREVFLASYTGNRGNNQFTKVQMKYEADQVLQAFFAKHREDVEQWFSVISPSGGSLEQLRDQMSMLRDKDWQVIHQL